MSLFTFELNPVKHYLNCFTYVFRMYMGVYVNIFASAENVLKTDTLMDKDYYIHAVQVISIFHHNGTVL